MAGPRRCPSMLASAPRWTANDPKPSRIAQIDCLSRGGFACFEDHSAKRRKDCDERSVSAIADLRKWHAHGS
eukprot:6458334-Amphidinium_carterae.1